MSSANMDDDVVYHQGDAELDMTLAHWRTVLLDAANEATATGTATCEATRIGTGHIRRLWP
jgi:hypothetical protein